MTVTPAQFDESDCHGLCREVFYNGHVQGVGFRFTTWTVAQRYAVTGYVENLADGRVHLEVEGARQEVERFLQDVARNLGQFIRGIQADSRPAAGHWHDFSIRH